MRIIDWLKDLIWPVKFDAKINLGRSIPRRHDMEFNEFNATCMALYFKIDNWLVENKIKHQWLVNSIPGDYDYTLKLNSKDAIMLKLSLGI